MRCTRISIGSLFLCATLALSIGSAIAATSKAGDGVPSVRILVMRDGSFEMEGVRYTDWRALRWNVEQIEKRHPRPSFKLVTQNNIPFESVGRVILILQEAGVPKIGFLMEPREK